MYTEIKKNYNFKRNLKLICIKFTHNAFNTFMVENNYIITCFFFINFQHNVYRIEI